MLSYAQLGVAAVGITMDYYPLGFSSWSPATSCTVDGWKGCDFYPLFVSALANRSGSGWVSYEVPICLWKSYYFQCGAWPTLDLASAECCTNIMRHFEFQDYMTTCACTSMVRVYQFRVLRKSSEFTYSLRMTPSQHVEASQAAKKLCASHPPRGCKEYGWTDAEGGLRRSLSECCCGNVHQGQISLSAMVFNNTVTQPIGSHWYQRFTRWWKGALCNLFDAGPPVSNTQDNQTYRTHAWFLNQTKASSVGETRNTELYKECNI
jgi:hypothetical protein